jgi:hypothetical protein
LGLQQLRVNVAGPTISMLSNHLASLLTIFLQSAEAARALRNNARLAE